MKKCYEKQLYMIPPEIKVLPEDVANRIAAGEVIERPAAAVKELLENSIDAGATRIDIEFKNGGKSFIKISDNGCGMTRDQLLMSLRPHATSKIDSPEDLFRISSYGFRGEAVPSIASVSKFRISSRPESQNEGNAVEVFAGDIKNVMVCGMPVGTETVVENLFCSVPARRKFLKSDNVEASHISKLCRLYALALPKLSISLVENSKILFRSERDLPLLERIARIFGRDIAESLVEMPFAQRDGISVEGAVLKAGESFATNRNICAFINSRPVESRAVYSALKEAYAHFLPKGRYAAAYLFINLDPSTVDVNVHPSKREVRLKNEFAVRDFLCENISATLSKFSISYRSEFSPDSKVDSADSVKRDIPDRLKNDSQPKGVLPRPAFTPSDFRPKTSAIPPFNFTKVRSISEENNPDGKTSTVEVPSIPKVGCENPQDLNPSEKNSITTKKPQLPQWRYIGSIGRRYALFESEKGLVVMYVSSALRRIKYAKIMDGLKGIKKASQILLIPISLKFERGDAEYFESNKKSFSACGFDIEDFGRDFYKISAIPEWMGIAEAENFIRDFVSLARDEERGMKKKRLADEMFARLSVSRTGAAGFPFDEFSSRALLDELLGCQSHMSSPDGTPTLKEIPFSDISRFFGA